MQVAPVHATPHNREADGRAPSDRSVQLVGACLAEIRGALEPESPRGQRHAIGRAILLAFELREEVERRLYRERWARWLESARRR